MNEGVINNCYTWTLSKEFSELRNRESLRNIKDLLELIIEDGIPLVIKLKTQCLISIVNKMLDGKSAESAGAEVATLPKYKQDNGLMEFLDAVLYRKDDMKGFKEEKKIVIQTIEDHKTMYSIQATKPKIKSLIDELDCSDSIKEQEIIMGKMRSVLKQYGKKSISNKSSSLSIGTENGARLLEEKLKRTSKANKIPTGLQYLDDKILNGGWERTRLYILGGATGAGKSTILLNCLMNAIKYPHYQGELNDKFKAFLYITLELDKSETYGRILCAHWDKSDIQLNRIISTEGPDAVDAKFQTELKQKYNSSIEMHYIDSDTLSSDDICDIIDNTIENFGGKEKCIVPLIIVDYIDLVDSNKKTEKEAYRKATNIAYQMKMAAREYDIPIVTATQLNRDGLSARKRSEMENLSIIGESMGKNYRADFVALFKVDPEDRDKLMFNIGKNRSGISNIQLDLFVNFENFKVLGCKKHEKKKKEDPDRGLLPLPEKVSPATYNPIEILGGGLKF